MTHEGSRPNEAVSRRADSMLDLLNGVNRTIDRSIPGSSYVAFGRLQYAVHAGIEITNPLFMEAEEKTIHSALTFFNAGIEKKLVNTVISRMMTLNTESPDQRHEVKIFPEIGTMSLEEPSPWDILQAIPAEVIKSLPSAVEMARAKIFEHAVTPDELSRIGLSPKEFYSIIIFKNSRTLTLPTRIPGVYIRHISDSEKPSGVVEFVMEPIV